MIVNAHRFVYSMFWCLHFYLRYLVFFFAFVIAKSMMQFFVLLYFAVFGLCSYVFTRLFVYLVGLFFCVLALNVHRCLLSVHVSTLVSGSLRFDQMCLGLPFQQSMTGNSKSNSVCQVASFYLSKVHISRNMFLSCHLSSDVHDIVRFMSHIAHICLADIVYRHICLANIMSHPGHICLASIIYCHMYCH